MSESIYNLIPTPEAKRQKPPRYTSKFPGDVHPTASTFGVTGSQTGVSNVAGDIHPQPRAHADHLPHSLFGPKDLHYSDPTAYRKKQSQPLLPSPSKHTYKHKVKPPVVKKTEKPTYGLKSNVNFVKTNAIEAPFSPQKGTAVAANTAPVKYVTKPDYGKVPEYLKDVKAEVKHEALIIETVVANQRAAAAANAPVMRLLPDAEREALLESLKLKWEAANSVYQTMTHNTMMDTKGKMRRKEECEQQLHTLEKSIEKLSKKLVYVHDDAPAHDQF